MQNFRTHALLVLLLGLPALLAGCGGSSGGSVENRCGLVVDIGPTSLVNGTLEPGDCRVSDLDPTIAEAAFVDEYRLTLSAPAIVTITMRSTTIDAILILLNRSASCSSGCTLATAPILAENDDFEPGTSFDAQILEVSLGIGSYLIVASEFDELAGSYTLETNL